MKGKRNHHKDQFKVKFDLTTESLGIKRHYFEGAGYGSLFFKENNF